LFSSNISFVDKGLHKTPDKSLQNNDGLEVSSFRTKHPSRSTETGIGNLFTDLSRTELELTDNHL